MIKYLLDNHLMVGALLTNDQDLNLVNVILVCTCIQFTKLKAYNSKAGQPLPYKSKAGNVKRQPLPPNCPKTLSRK